jgi:ketosteroid isomerase-like protein
MIVDDPETRAEVEALFRDYERALVTNDVAALDRFFRDGAETIRYGIEAIRAFRAGRSPVGLMRDLERTQITTYGKDFAIASTLFRRAGAPGKIGRQMQSWARLPEGWRIVAAHVSVIDDPDIKASPK